MSGQTGDDRGRKETTVLGDSRYSEAERMSRLVNDLLSLARADAGYVMEKIWIRSCLLSVKRTQGAVFGAKGGGGSVH